MGEILFLAHRVPFPPNRGDKIRAHHLLQKLAQLAPVHVGCLAESEEDRRAIVDLSAVASSQCVVNRNKPLVLAGVEAVLSKKPVSLTAFHSPRLENWVRAVLASHPIDTIVIFSGQMGQYIPDSFDGRVIVDLCDVDSAKFASYAENGERVWLNSREANLLSQEEQRLGQRADATILISENEANLYRDRLSSEEGINAKVIGNGIDAAFFDPDTVEPHAAFAPTPGPHFVFTGQMDYRPNEQAALWFIERALTDVRERMPDAEFHVVGRNPTQKLLDKRSATGVHIWGEVPDVRPFIAGADAVVVPLQIARGVQNKVLEAMAMARPVVLTQDAATGINAIDGVHWLQANLDGAAMAGKLAELASDPVIAQSIGTAARQFVLDNHAWDAVLNPLEMLVRKYTGDRRDAA